MEININNSEPHPLDEILSRVHNKNGSSLLNHPFIEEHIRNLDLLRELDIWLDSWLERLLIVSQRNMDNPGQAQLPHCLSTALERATIKIINASFLISFATLGNGNSHLENKLVCIGLHEAMLETEAVFLVNICKDTQYTPAQIQEILTQCRGGLVDIMHIVGNFPLIYMCALGKFVSVIAEACQYRNAKELVQMVTQNQVGQHFSQPLVLAADLIQHYAVDSSNSGGVVHLNLLPN